MRDSIYIAAFAVVALGMAAPSAVSAQQCYSASECAAGTVCVNGVCQQTAPPPPGYGGSATVTVQGGAQPGVGVQVQVQPPVPQQQVYVQPGQQYVQPQYGQPVYAQPVRQLQPRTETGHMTGLIVSGAVILGVGWLSNIFVSVFAGVGGTSSDEWDTFRYLGIVPVLGPWIQMAVKPTSLDEDDWAYYLTINGIIQAVGTTMLVLGIAIPVTRTVYAENGESEGIDLAIVPTGNGISLLGRF